MHPHYVDSEKKLNLSLEKIVVDYIADDELIFDWCEDNGGVDVLLIQKDVYLEGAELYKVLGVCAGGGRLIRFKLTKADWSFDGDSTWVN